MSQPAKARAVARPFGPQAAPTYLDPGPERISATATCDSPSALLGLWGDHLRSLKKPRFDGVRIVFEQGEKRFEAKHPAGSAKPDFAEGPHDYLDVNLPESLAPGPCCVHIERDGFRFASLDLEVVASEPSDVMSLSAEVLARTGEGMLEGSGAHTTAEFEIVDSTGAVCGSDPG